MSVGNRAYTQEYNFIEGPSSFASEYMEYISSAAGFGTHVDYSSTSFGRSNLSAAQVEAKPLEKTYHRAGHKRNLKVLPKTDARVNTAISLKTLIASIAIMLIVGIALLGAVSMRANASKIKCSINSFTKQNVVLENEIAVLNAKVEGGASFETIENYAVGTLGMCYPDSNRIMYIDENEHASSNLREVIREKAYE